MDDDSFPVISPEGGEELSFVNSWRSDLPQTVGDTDCFNFDAQPNESENLIIMRLTGAQLTEMLSALYIGAEFVYPEKYLEILRPLLAATSCPPLLEEQDCYDYPTYASFISYEPANPFIDPNFIPENYAVPPFLINLRDGNDVAGYEQDDIITPTDAMTFDVNWFDSLEGQLPTIRVMVQGQGKAFLKMLTMPAGGLAVITVDTPPNLLDIIGGVVGAGENIIDLNRDIVSLPPETAKELIFELDIVGTGLHTIYIVFLPILDDSFTPLRYGGGFRGVQLCDFVESGLDMGIQALRFDTCNLEYQDTEGNWQIVAGWENWLDCIPSGGGGGGAGSQLLPSVYAIQPIPASVTATSYTTFTDFEVEHNFTHPSALIIVSNLRMRKPTGAGGLIRLAIDGSGGGATVEVSIQNTELRPISISEVFGGLSGLHTIQVQGKNSSGGIDLNPLNSIVFTVIEFTNAADLFVQDIRIFEGELQKKIAGVWINVSDSLEAIISAIQATANNAAAAAAAAQSTANTALSSANSAISVNNTQNTRLTALEAFQDDAELELAQNALDHASFDSRLDTLESAGVAFAVTVDDTNLAVSEGSWSLVSAGGWASGQGYTSTSNIMVVENPLMYLDDRIVSVKIWFTMLPGGTSGYLTVGFTNDAAISESKLRVAGAAARFVAIARPAKTLFPSSIFSMSLVLENSGDRIRLDRIQIIRQAVP